MYQYDYSSSRTVRQREGVSAPLDEQYFYDDLDRLTEFHRGFYDSDMGEIAAYNNDRQFGQAWTLSETGDWNEFKHDHNGDDDYTDTSDLDQNLEFNLVNEITSITKQSDPAQTAVADPVYSARGNMTQPGSPPRDMNNVLAQPIHS